MNLMWPVGGAFINDTKYIEIWGVQTQHINCNDKIVEIECTGVLEANDDIYGHCRGGFSAFLTINRQDFDRQSAKDNIIYFTECHFTLDKNFYLGNAYNILAEENNTTDKNIIWKKYTEYLDSKINKFGYLYYNREAK